MNYLILIFIIGCFIVGICSNIYEKVKNYKITIAKIDECEKEKEKLKKENILLKAGLFLESDDNWSVGVAYERYIGYLYECYGYSVIYYGAINGLSDLGRDLIAESDNEILIIQCKLRAEDRKIYPNIICQLYGTTEQYKIHYDGCKSVRGVLISSVELAPISKIFANDLKIEFIENRRMSDKYPHVKCKNNTKLYYTENHPEYDNIQINFKNGDTYVHSPQEAHNLGYKLAK